MIEVYSASSPDLFDIWVYLGFTQLCSNRVEIISAERSLPATQRESAGGVYSEMVHRRDLKMPQASKALLTAPWTNFHPNTKQ